MKQVNLNVHDRTKTGRGHSRRLRKAGSIPAVVYGASGLRHLSIDGREFAQLWKQVHGRSALIHLQFDEGDPMFSIIKDAQREATTGEFLHVDFLEIQRGKAMSAAVPIFLKGNPEGVRNEGGVLEQQLDEVDVTCRPRDLPERIEVDVTDLGIAESIHVSDLPPVEGVTYDSDPELVVALVSGKVAVVEEPTEEEEGVELPEGAEPAEGEEEPEEREAAESEA